MAQLGRSVQCVSKPAFVRFPSRRSVVYSVNGIVASTQALAVEAGQRILRMGGNAADAAVATAAALNVTEPASTGIGGDMFCLFYDVKTKQVHAINGSGRSARNTTIEQIKDELGIKAGTTGTIPIRSALAVTVPGAAAGWIDTVDRFGSGRVSLSQILEPAIELCDKGFPVSEISARLWRSAENDLKNASTNFRELLKPDLAAEKYSRAPYPGEIMRNPALANTFEDLARYGKEGFYTGRVAQAIVEAVRDNGGHLTLNDLAEHIKMDQEETAPVSLQFSVRTCKNPERSNIRQPLELWEHAPNGQGIVALMALGIFQHLQRMEQVPQFGAHDHNSAVYLHALIESLRIAFADGTWWISDASSDSSKATELLSDAYLANRAKLFREAKAGTYSYGQPSVAHNSCDTVYLAVTDQEGNGMSFVNSLYGAFGSCIVPSGCGLALQGRGAGFALGPEDHPNLYHGGKRPYHTIIPALLTRRDSNGTLELDTVYGVMGGFMQPQGHLQVLFNMELFGMSPQEALDAPRFCIGGERMSDIVHIEEGIEDSIAASLSSFGHRIERVNGWQREVFGRGQVIRREVDRETGISVYAAGSDMRADGCAMPVG